MGFRFYTLFILLVLFPLCTWAQHSASISGVVVHKYRNKPIPFANIALLKSNTSSIANGCTSDFEGRFSMDKLDAGIYKLQVSVLGFKPYIQDSVVLKEGTQLLLDTIVIRRQKTELDEIEVVAERAMIEQSMGKTTLNVNDGMAGSGENAIDLLRYLPSASTDEDNNVLLRGAPATIMIDGVETDISNALDNLPVGIISKIEVINNPSAKYSAQSGAGIINVVLKKDKIKGANGRINGAIGTPDKQQAGLQLLLKRNRLTSTSNLSYARFKDEVYSLNKRITETNSDTSFLNNEGLMNKVTSVLNFRQGFKYTINDKSFLNLRAMLRFNNTDYNSENEAQKYRSDLSPQSRNINTTEGSTEKKYWKLGANYKVDFSEEVNLMVLLEHENQSNNAPNDRIIRYYDVETGEEKKDFKTQNRDKPEDIKSTKFKLDFEKLLNEDLKLESGALIIHRNSNVFNDFLKTSHKFNSENNSYETEIDSSQRFSFEVEELMPSAYTLFTYEKDKWQMSGGLRYEYVYLQTGSLSNDTSVNNQYSQWLPSLQLERQINKKLSFGLSATRRTKMPKYQQLNPVVVYHGIYSKSSGNPNLRPEKITNIELSANGFIKKNRFSSAIFYKYFEDMISMHQHIVIEDENEVLYREFENIGELKQLGAEINYHARLPKKVNLKFNVLGLHQSINNVYKGNEVAIDDWSYAGKLTADQTFLKKYRWQVNGVYNSDIASITGENLELYYLNVGLRGQFMKKKLSINLQFNDVFDTLNREKINTTSPNFVQNSYMKSITQKVLLSISYSFSTYSKK